MTDPITTPAQMREAAIYYIDCEFDGHSGPLLSLAMVRGDGYSTHIRVNLDAKDPWVQANVMPIMDSHDADVSETVDLVCVGQSIRDFIGTCQHPTIIADSPVDIWRFCAAISTASDGQWSSVDYPKISFAVHNVACYPTTLAGAVQHNAWWDAMALRDTLCRALPVAEPAPVSKILTSLAEAKAFQDAILTGTGVMRDGEYVAPQDFFAKPAPVAVRVKPLVWQMENGRQDDCPQWIAEVEAKRYEVFKAWWGDQDKWGFVAMGKFYHTEDAAQAAANADHAARILSQIDAVSVAQVRAEALEAAAKLATSFLVGDPKNGVPLRNPLAHEIAAAIRALIEKEPEPVAVNAVMCAAERDAQSRDAVDLTLFRQAIRAEALEEAAALPPYDCDGDPAGSFDHHVFVKRDAIRALIEKEPNE